MASFNATVDRYKAMLANLDAGQLELPNENLDSGEPTVAGKYKGADEAFAKLVGKLEEQQFAGTSPELRQNILTFYQDEKAPVSARSNEKEAAEWAKLREQLDQLKAIP